MPTMKIFHEVTRGQKFIDPESEQECKKLFHEYILRHCTDFENAYYYNSIVVSTGCLTHIPDEREVQVFL